MSLLNIVALLITAVAAGMAAILDLFIGFVAVVISTIDPTRLDARIVGGISICLMPAHSVVSFGHGLSDIGWIVYAATCNGAFVVQCLVTGGWLDGMGRGVSRFLSRFRGLPFLRFRGR
jgi:hypothetical protein